MVPAHPSHDTAYRRILKDLANAGRYVVELDDGRAKAQCPVPEHGAGTGDPNPSLALTASRGRVLVACHAGCSTPDVLAHLGRTMADLFDNRYGIAYLYDDGRQVNRNGSKQFTQGGNRSGDALYRVEHLGDAEHVYVTEGEQDVDAIVTAGGVAVCSAMGAGKAALFDWNPLAGRHLTVIPDMDDAGFKHAATVVAILRPIAASVTVKRAKVGKDAADHIARHHGLDELVPFDLPLQPAPEAAAVDEREAANDPNRWRVTSGASFILDQPKNTPALWGDGEHVLWSEGDGLMIAGGQGLGKTTLAGLLLRGLLGLDTHVLGQPVNGSGETILYLAMDRPRQIARSMARQFSAAERDILDARVLFRPGPPEADLARNPELLLAMARELSAGIVFVDSLKDAAVGLSDDETGAGYNRARQYLHADGRNICDLHHITKAPKTEGTVSINDVYGSTWLTSGCGSVILMTGAPGDPIVGFRHVKQPMDEYGPYKLSHDPDTGRLDIWHSVDPVELLRAAGVNGLNAKQAASAMFDIDKPTQADAERAKRKLNKLMAEHPALGIERVEGTKGKGYSTTWYLPVI